MKDPAVVKKLFENLQSDLRLLSTEGKRKHPNVKEVISSIWLQDQLICYSALHYIDQFANLLSFILLQYFVSFAVTFA